MRGQYLVACLFIRGLVVTVTVTLSIPFPTPINDTQDPVKNFSCITFDYEVYILCTWSIEPSTNYSLNVKLSYILESHVSESNVSERRLPCTDKTDTTCKLDMIDLDIDPDIGYINACIISCYTIHYSKRVKPSTVYDIETTTNSSCIEIKWKHSRSVEAWGEQIYRIQVASRWMQTAKITTWKEARFCSLIPNTKYSISVSVKPKESGVWSDAVITSGTTLSDLPYNPPTTCMNCFRVFTEGSSIKIHLYWKNLQQEHWNDEVMNYRLEGKSACMNKSHFAEKHVFNDSTSSSPYKMEMPAACHPFQVSLWSMNTHGMSPASSQITVPESSKLLPAPKALGYLNNDMSVLNVTWETDGRNNHTKYTLFWCRRGVIMSCTSEVNWVEVIDRVWVEISVSTDSQYMFAVAKERNGAVTGIHWTDCILRDSGISFPPEVEISNNGKEVHIWWHFPRCSEIYLQGHLTKFEITYCFSRDCYDKKVLSVNSSVMEILIPFDQHHSEACATVQAVFQELGPESQWICTHRSSLHERVHTTWWIVISVAIGLCIGALLCVFLYRRFTKKRFEIQVPPIKRNVSSTNRRILETSAASSESENCPMLRKGKQYCDQSINFCRKNQDNIPSENRKENNYSEIAKTSKDSSSSKENTLDTTNEREYIAFDETKTRIITTSGSEHLSSDTCMPLRETVQFHEQKDHNILQVIL